MKIKHIAPFVIPFVIFLGISISYFSPVLNGKEIFQTDIVNFRAGAKEAIDFRKNTGEETYWSNDMFGGMPTYQNGALYPYDFIKKIDKALRFLPRPADYLFLMLLSSFILIYTLKRNISLSIIGAIFLSFSTYHFQILTAGHNAKMHAIAYIPLVISSLILIYQKKYKLGFILGAFAWGLQIATNHFQMTYYMGLMITIYVLVEGIESFKNKNIKTYINSTLLIVTSLLVGLLLNAGRLITTYKYSKETTRGKSEITLDKKEITDGLDKEYITQWSYGITETLNLWIPDFMGGGTSEYKEKIEQKYVPKAQQYFQNINPKELSPLEIQKVQSELQATQEQGTTYWGNQPFTSGPAYQGSLIFFFFIFGLFIVKEPLKWWLLIATFSSFSLAWGKNFMPLTNLFIDYFPMYAKFRAVSSILIVAEFTIPLLGIIALGKVVESKDKKQYLKPFLISVGISIGTLILFYILGSNLFSFKAEGNENLPPQIFETLKNIRVELFKESILRTLFITIFAAAAIFAYFKNKIKGSILLVLIGLLTLTDLWSIGKRYLNDSNFVSPIEMKLAFSPGNQKNKALINLKKQDKSIFRIWDTSNDPYPEYASTYTQSAIPSYFNHSIGGYHASKLKRFQDLHDYHLSSKNWAVANMLNVKYILTPKGIELNENALGNAWDINKIYWAPNANSELLQLNNLHTDTSIVVDEKFKENIQNVDPNNSTTQIELTDYKPNHLIYKSNATGKDIVVFSEIYFKDGWQAYIDGKPTEHFRANYVLRAMVVPEGKHNIEFKFEPKTIHYSSLISLFIFIGLIILLIVFLKGIFTKKNEA